MDFYLAAPFFSDEQRSVCHQIEHRAKEVGLYCFSPRKEALCPPGAPFAQRKKSFDMNCTGIRNSWFVLARIDDFDPGTIWELGFAHGLRHELSKDPGIHGTVGVDPLNMKPKVYCFTTFESGRGLNLMLAQGSNGFLQGIPKVMEFLRMVREQKDFSLAEAWKKEIE